MRIDYASAAPGAFKAMLNVESYVQGCGLEASVLELVKTRASQINGCAYCLDMHTKDALAGGETAQRLFLLSAWQEAHCYTPRERAALAWTDAMTLVASSHMPDDVYNEALLHFTEAELVNLTLAIIAINGWNRLAIGFRKESGTYHVGQ